MYDVHPMRVMAHLPRRHLLGLALVVVTLGLGVNLLHLVGALYVLQLVDRVVHTGSLPTLLVLTALALAAIAVQQVFDHGRRRLAQSAAHGVESALCAPLAVRITALPRPQEHLLDDVRLATRGGVAAAMAITDAIWIPVGLAVLAWLHWRLGLVAACGVLASATAGACSGYAAWRAVQDQQLAVSEAQQRRRRLLRDDGSVLGNGMAGAVARRLTALQQEERRLDVQLQGRTTLGGVIAVGVRSTAMIVVQALCVWLIVGGELSLGVLFAVNLLTGRVLAPVEALGHALVPASQAWLAWRRLRAVPELAAGTATPVLTTGGISVEGLSWQGHSRATPLFSAVSFRARPGQVVVLAGAVGCGKTTLLRLMAGIEQPLTGEVRWNGNLLSGIDPEHRGRHGGYLPQSPELLDGTVADNIARFRPQADQGAIEAAARKAGCHADVLALPDGYATEIGRNGMRLSGGQRQLIALARAVFGDPALVFLDEPNANLDGDREVTLMRCIRSLAQAGATVFVASHRSRILAVVDTVLLFDGHGQVEELDKESFLRRRQDTRTITQGGA